MKSKYLMIVAALIGLLVFYTVAYAQSEDDGGEEPVQAMKVRTMNGTVAGSPMENPTPSKHPGTVMGSPMEIPTPTKNPGTVMGSPMEIPRPPKISLMANNGMFVVSEKGGGNRVLANRKQAREWETFYLVDINGGQLMSGDKIYLKTYLNSYYLSASTGRINATRKAAGSTEMFTIINIRKNGVITNGSKIALQSYNGHYIAAEKGGGSVLNANRKKVGSWETFTLFIK